MTIRIKILSITVSLLVVFGIVVGVSAILQRQVANEVSSITRYHDPLTAAIADFDVVSFEYELLLLRLLRRADADKNEIESITQREQKIAEEMHADFATAERVTAEAVNDDKLPAQSRLLFARLQGLVSMLRRKLPPFVEVGQQVMQALAEGRLKDARRLSLGFRAYEEAFGPDLPNIIRLRRNAPNLLVRMGIVTGEVADLSQSSDRRNRPGVNPVTRRKFSVRRLWLENPAVCAISAIERSSLRRRSIACPTRLSVTNRCGDFPTEVLNACPK